MFSAIGGDEPSARNEGRRSWRNTPKEKNNTVYNSMNVVSISITIKWYCSKFFSFLGTRLRKKRYYLQFNECCFVFKDNKMILFTIQSKFFSFSETRLKKKQCCLRSNECCLVWRSRSNNGTILFAIQLKLFSSNWETGLRKIRCRLQFNAVYNSIKIVSF